MLTMEASVKLMSDEVFPIYELSFASESRYRGPLEAFIRKDQLIE